MFDLRNSRVLVAGGTSGIGLATAKLLTELGASLVITGRDPVRLAAAEKEVGPGTVALSFDASDSSQLSDALSRIGSFNHLVIALSGGKGAGKIQDLTVQQLQTGFDAKFHVHYSMARASLRHLSDAGSITFVSAISARSANPGTAGLSAINSAIEGLVRPLAVELRPRRVNAVSPGVIDTPWWNWLAPDQREATFRKFAASSPVGRIGKPIDVAQAIAFLIGNSFMTGCILECDGGLRLVGQSL